MASIFTANLSWITTTRCRSRCTLWTPSSIPSLETVRWGGNF